MRPSIVPFAFWAIGVVSLPLSDLKSKVPERAMKISMQPMASTQGQGIKRTRDEKAPSYVYWHEDAAEANAKDDKKVKRSEDMDASPYVYYTEDAAEANTKDDKKVKRSEDVDASPYFYFTEDAAEVDNIPE